MPVKVVPKQTFLIAYFSCFKDSQAIFGLCQMWFGLHTHIAVVDCLLDLKNKDSTSLKSRKSFRTLIKSSFRSLFCQAGQRTRATTVREETLSCQSRE